MTTAKVAVSIVTYNSKHIFSVLDNLMSEFSEDTNFRFLLFDNNSSNEYKAKLKQYEDFVDITYYHENKGFGFGHNFNLLHAPEKYFVVFNPDILLKRESLMEMLDYTEKHNDVSLVVPKVLNSDGSVQHLIRNQVSVFDYMLRFIPFGFIKEIFSKRLETYECRNISDADYSNIRIGSGCFMLLRGEDFKHVKGFDDRYFMYFEDYDLCLTFEKHNMKSVYTPFSTVIHFYERGAHKNFKLFKLFMNSMYKFFNKWGWRLF